MGLKQDIVDAIAARKKTTVPQHQDNPPGRNPSLQITPNPELGPEVKDVDPTRTFTEGLDSFVNQTRADMQTLPAYHADDDLIGQGSQRSRNVNAHSREETLRLSRLADAINNRYYRRPTTISSLGGVYGGGMTGSNTQWGGTYQMPIQTEEMRQQDRTRQYEAATRARELQRQQGIEDLTSLEDAREQYRHRLQMAGNLSKAEIEKYMDQWDYAMGYYPLIRQQQMSAAFHEWQQRLDKIGIPNDQAIVLSQLANQYPTIAPMLGALFGGISTPTQDEITFLNAMNNQLQTMRRRGTSEIEINRALNKMRVQELMTQFGITSGGLFDGVQRLPDTFQQGRR